MAARMNAAIPTITIACTAHLLLSEFPALLPHWNRMIANSASTIPIYWVMLGISPRNMPAPITVGTRFSR